MADEQKPWNANVVLRTDGPTLAEYIAAGYSKESYPPEGYAAKADPAEAALAEKAKQHLEASVQPQLNEIERAEVARLEQQAKENDPAYIADVQRQREANAKIVVTPEGISHMDLLGTAMHLDRRVAALQAGEEVEPYEPSVRVQNTPEGFEPSVPQPVKWEPGK